jgi:hypothetical protein
MTGKCCEVVAEDDQVMQKLQELSETVDLLWASQKDLMEICKRISRSLHSTPPDMEALNAMSYAYYNSQK